LTLALHHRNKFTYRGLQGTLNTTNTVFIILITCLGITSAILVSIAHGPIIFTAPSLSFPPSSVDLGSVNGFIMSSNGLPVGGASVHVYKHMGLIDSVDKNVGYSASIMTDSDGSYLFDGLPSGVYKFTVTYPNGVVRTIGNYAVWPSSSSSYIFKG
jgi:hypothetical protein